MKLKKIAAACALTFAFTPAMADSSQFQGFSAALGVSFNGGNAKVSGGDLSLDFGQTSQVGVIDLGYGFGISPSLVIGAGIAYDLGKTKFGSITDSEGNLSFESKNQYAVYVQPTWVINNSAGLYAKLGYNWAKGTSSGIDDDDEPFNESTNFKGMSYAIGIKTFLDKNLFFQVEAGMVNLKSKSFFEGDFTVKPKMSRATVSLGYRF
jgi:opacity protein-like surface antigen